VLIAHAPLGVITGAVQALVGLLRPSASVFLLLCNDVPAPEYCPAGGVAVGRAAQGIPRAAPGRRGVPRPAASRIDSRHHETTQRCPDALPAAGLVNGEPGHLVAAAG
jgi:hypothetical protein